MVARNEFRQDLYYRLSGFTLRLPSLRERADDIPLLIDYFLRTIGREMSRTVSGITDQAREVLTRHTWPGNVRELHNAIRYAVVHSIGGIITEDCLPQSCRQGIVNPSAAATDNHNGAKLADVRSLVHELLQTRSTEIYRQVGQTVDEILLSEVLRATDGNQLQAAERLGISRVTLRAKLRTLRSGQSDASNS
jgi:two-component system nitrogen regulation response regulator GlnG